MSTTEHNAMLLGLNSVPSSPGFGHPPSPPASGAPGTLHDGLPPSYPPAPYPTSPSGPTSIIPPAHFALVQASASHPGTPDYFQSDTQLIIDMTIELREKGVVGSFNAKRECGRVFTGSELPTASTCYPGSDRHSALEKAVFNSPADVMEFFRTAVVSPFFTESRNGASDLKLAIEEQWVGEADLGADGPLDGVSADGAHPAPAVPPRSAPYPSPSYSSCAHSGPPDRQGRSVPIQALRDSGASETDWDDLPFVEMKTTDDTVEVEVAGGKGRLCSGFE